QDLARAPDRFLGVDGAVGLDVDDELVEVRALLDTRTLDRVGHAANRAERRVELQPADGPRLFLESRYLRGRMVAAAAHDLEERPQLAGLRQIGDDEIRIDDLHIMLRLNVAGGDRTRPLLGQR